MQAESYRVRSQALTESGGEKTGVCARQRDSKHKCSSVPKRRTLEEMKAQLSCCLVTEWPPVEDDTDELGRNWMS